MSAPEIGIRLDTVVPEAVSWLWPGRIPFGMLTVLDGDPSLGKSTLSLDIAARLSRGLPMPGCSEANEPAGVVLLSAEDDLAVTVRPRLDAAGADCSRILALPIIGEGEESRPPSIPEDLDALTLAVAQVDARLVVLDPLMAILSPNVDAHKDQSIRRALHLLSVFAGDTGAAVLIVRHLNKQAGGNPLYRGGGSIGIVGAARSGLLVGRDPDDPTRRVLASTKSNLAPEQPSLAWHLESAGDVSRVVWDGISGHDAGDLLAEQDSSPSALDEAREVIAEVLADGPLPAMEARRAIKERGVADRTMWRARKLAGVVARKDGMKGGWLWELPSDAETAKTTDTLFIGGLGTLRDSRRSSEPERIPFDDPEDEDDDIEEIEA